MGSLFLDNSIPRLLRGLADRSLRAADLAEATAAAIQQSEPNTLAWVCYDLERLRAAAQRVDETQRRGRLAGVPFGIKDIFNTKQFPTEMGSPIWKDFRPGNNARVVDSLVVAGALPVGKTVTAEFAVHALNDTRNPHAPSHTPGTSSSGSAAAVATGMVPFALGSQTAGSIIRPASFCGIWGMKPSFGLIPRTAVLKTTDSLDTIGFLAAHGTSLRPILDEVRVTGPDYPYVYRHVDGRRATRDHRQWRVGVVKTHVWPEAPPYAQQAILTLADRIGHEPGFSVEDVTLPPELEQSHALHATLYSKSLAYYFQRESVKSHQISPIMRAMMAEGEGIEYEHFLESLEAQRLIARLLDAALEPYDFVLSLGTASSAPQRGVTELPDPSLIWTLCHVPAVLAPAFRSPDGLPFGVQFVGRRWTDYQVLDGIETLVERGVLPGGSMPIVPGALNPPGDPAAAFAVDGTDRAESSR